ncbi:MAG: pseudouridine synthase [Cytophagaceae bacterium]|nr:pseudouridine synthase [Cytophagaceae bacterium]
MANKRDDRRGGDRNDDHRPNNRPSFGRKPGPNPRSTQPNNDRPTGGRPTRPTGFSPRRDEGDRRNDDRSGNDHRPDSRSNFNDNRPTRPTGFSPRRDDGNDRRDNDRSGERGPRREGSNERPFSPRKPYGASRPEGDRPRRPGSERPSGGERKPFGPRPSFGQKSGFGRPERRSDGEFRRDDDRRGSAPRSEDRRESRPFGSDRRGGDSRSNDSRSEFRPGGDRQNEDRRTFRSRPGESDFRAKRPDSGPRDFPDKKRFDNSDRPNNERRDKPFGDRPARKFGDKPAFGSKRPDADGPRPRRETDTEYPTPRPDSEGLTPRKPLFKSRSRYDEADGRTPNYDLDRFRANAPKRIQSKIREEDRETIRLNRYIANAGVCSRRDADKLIESGEVTVNGKVVTVMGHQVKPGDVVKYGNRVLNPEKLLYVLLNKPKDFITTTDDPDDRRTVMDLVKNAGPQRIYPVGRLDRNTTGLILLTNDGELADKLMHPSHEIRKVYQVELDKPFTTEHFEQMKAGFELEDGAIKPDELAIVTPDAQVVGIEIHSGRNRIVRRMFEHLGYEVTKLDRTVYAGLDKKDLPRGNWRYLTEKEVIKLKYF